MIDTKNLRKLTQAALAGHDGVSLNWVKLLQDFQQAASPAAISELLDRLEAAEKERDALRAELTDLRNSMTFRTSLIGRIEAEREDLHALIAAVKKQVNAEFRLRMKKEIECNALRAEIEEMKQQEPFAWIVRGGYPGPLDKLEWQLWYGSEKPTLPWVNQETRPLYALPGAKALLRVPDAVMAALDNLDDYIARIEGNDRGACNHINLLRRYLLDAADVGENK